MALTAASLADGTLSNTKGALYTATGPTILKSITLVNTDASARTVNLYLKTANSRHIIPVDLSIAAGAAYLDDLTRTMSSGDVLEGDASVASVVEYWVSGATA